MVIGMGLERSAGQFVPSCAENLHTGIRSQMPPSSDEQIRFMVNIQRLLDEGLFTASNKFALLLALAVLSIEQGDDSGAPLELTTDAIAEKFVQYYWRQVVPYVTAGEATILQQNTDRQAAIVNLVREARASYGGSLTAAMRDLAGWRRLVRKVARVVREMPLWRLQRIGAEQLNFLYENRGDGGVIQLLPGIAYCFRKFHALISDLVQGAWSETAETGATTSITSCSVVNWWTIRSVETPPE